MLTPGKTKLTKTSCDVKDNKFLVCAIEAKASYLVTSDEDLLTLKEYASTHILTPHEFVKLIETGKL